MNRTREVPTPGQELPEVEEVEKHEEAFDELDFVKLGREAFQDSTTFFDIKLRGRLEKNYSLAYSRHPSGSKYYTDKYKYRSKVFRGKTQSAIMRNLAAATLALFSTDDVISIKPEIDDNKKQTTAADIVNKILNYRFASNLPWFRTCIGALSEAQIAGFVCSKQYWAYEEGPDLDSNEINEWGDEGYPTKPIKDDPVIELIPPENVRLHPSCDWIDPVNSSPYVIIMYPMYVSDVRERMEKDWIEATDDVIIAAGDMSSDSVRMARDGDKAIDSKDQVSTIRDYDIVWCREIFMNVEGIEIVYYMLGDTHLLSEPMPLSAVYPHCTDNKRPLAWGVSSIDPHRPYSIGLPERVEGSQIQANDIANQRFDNVQQVLNKRFLAVRSANVDYRSLMTNVPGSITLTDSLDAVMPMNTEDITSSAYQEQAMINMDFDEIAGTFSNSSVGTNRQLNETVGGMKLMSGSANTMTEYQLRIFVETWAEVVIRQCVKMIQTYEDNATIREITGGKGTSAMINENLNVRVNVGFGATDPQHRISGLMMGLASIAKVSPSYMSRLNMQEVTKEVFGAIGYRDGDRFFSREKGMVPVETVKKMQKKLQEMQKIIETKQVETQGRVQIEKMKSDSSYKEAALKAQADSRIKMTELAVGKDMKLAELQQKAGVNMNKYLLDTMEALNRKVMAMNQTRELNYKINTGNQGI